MSTDSYRLEPAYQANHIFEFSLAQKRVPNDVMTGTLDGVDLQCFRLADSTALVSIASVYYCATVARHAGGRHQHGTLEQPWPRMWIGPRRQRGAPPDRAVRIRFDHAKFDRRFRVHAEDEPSARAALSDHAMDYLVSLRYPPGFEITANSILAFHNANRLFHFVRGTLSRKERKALLDAALGLRTRLTPTH